MQGKIVSFPLNIVFGNKIQYQMKASFLACDCISLCYSCYQRQHLNIQWGRMSNCRSYSFFWRYGGSSNFSQQQDRVLWWNSAPCSHLNNKTDTYVGDIQGVGNIGHSSTTPGLSTTSLFDLHVSYLLIPEEDCFVIFFLATTLK